MMKYPLISMAFLSGCFVVTEITAQPSPVQKNAFTASLSFIDYQKTFPRSGEALKRKEDTLKKQFLEKNLQWPARFVYIRSFKYDSELEIWVKDELKEPFRLFNTYKICALAGALGPKRMEGDYQVPEGFYCINEFNPNSSYHLSLGLNYPNVSDKILSDPVQPGGEIYIHGSCVTVGCIPVTDARMEDIYIIAAYAKSMGQDFIPVHIFPVRYSVKKSADYLSDFVKEDTLLKNFSSRLEDAFYYFEKSHQLPVILINEKGEYIVDGALPKKSLVIKEEMPVKKNPATRRTRKIDELPDVVQQWPQFPGGTTAYSRFLQNLGKDMTAFLPRGNKKAFLKIEFIIDRDGVPVNIRLDKSISEEFDNELISRLENMGTWQPALLQNKPVARKMIQTFTVE